MKKFFLWTALSFSFLPLSVRAATIQNLDNKPYSLVVKQEDKTFQVFIDSSGTIKDLCAFCTIEVIGFSLMDVENEAYLVIRGGVLSIQN
ncbi:MAG: hypothetical protein ACI4TE_05955 [Alphaproteobacteria bacterium]